MLWCFTRKKSLRRGPITQSIQWCYPDISSLEISNVPGLLSAVYLEMIFFLQESYQTFHLLYSYAKAESFRSRYFSPRTIMLASQTRFATVLAPGVDSANTFLQTLETFDASARVFNCLHHESCRRLEDTILHDAWQEQMCSPLNYKIPQLLLFCPLSKGLTLHKRSRRGSSSDTPSVLKISNTSNLATSVPWHLYIPWHSAIPSSSPNPPCPPLPPFSSLYFKIWIERRRHC